ncbi:MAG: mCpol domain-containing protein [Nostocaceae cyanobacterium]|nr:mCpol domain-containing protein [Nostocaceae cyanobacterium]
MSTKTFICIGDGDNIGDVIDFHLLSESLEEARKFSFQVKNALEKIAQLAQSEINASLVYVAGDDICFIVNTDINIVEKLISYSNFFLKSTGKTMSFGVGETSIEASISLRKAKVSGKGCVLSFGGICN